MNILKKYVLNNIKLNRKRTFATIISIALSTMLIASVLIISNSFYTTLKKDAILTNGNQHATFVNINKKQAEQVISDKDIESYFVTQLKGYAKINNTIGKDYLAVMEFDKNALENFGVTLVEGRLPKNSNEIVIPTKLIENSNEKFSIGQNIELELNKLYLDNFEEIRQDTLYTKSYKKQDRVTEKYIETKQYKIVGIINKAGAKVETMKSAGYSAITFLNEIDEIASYSVRFKNVRDIVDLRDKFFEKIGRYASVNEQLVMLEGANVGNDMALLLVILIASIIIVLVICSVLIIRSSFYVSFSEKVKQYSILSSIGAKNKEIKKLVYKENFIISTIGIVVGLVLSIIISYLLTLIIRHVTLENSFFTTTNIIFDVKIWILFIAILISYTTMYIASSSSINRVNGISPLMGIMQNEDMSIDTDIMKENKILKKFFGIGGIISFKSIKKDKNKYNSVVITLTISIAMIIVIASFVKYIEVLNDNMNEAKKYNVIVQNFSDILNSNNMQEVENAYNIFKDVASNIDVNKYSIIRRAKINTNLSKYISTENMYLYDNLMMFGQNFNVEVIGKEEYKRYIDEIGLEYDYAKNGIIVYRNKNQNGIWDGENLKQILDIEVGDSIYQEVKNNKVYDLKVVAITDKSPMGYENIACGLGIFIMSDELFDEMFDSYNLISMHVYTNKAKEYCKYVDNRYEDLITINQESENEKERNKILIMYIVLYGTSIIISIIAITSVYNSVSSSIMLRKKEFSMLQSIGMTTKEFKNMINLESLFYSIESIFTGNLIGILLNFGIWYLACKISKISILIPYIPIILVDIFVFIFINLIEKHLTKNITLNNIIESIKNENT